jgi:foldase protein PrsA
MSQRKPRNSRRSKFPQANPREEYARRKKQGHRRRWGIVGVAVVLVLAIATVPAYGYYTSFMAPPNTVVARINDVEVKLGDVARMSKVFIAMGKIVGADATLATVPFDALNGLVDGELIRQNAHKLGISVTRSEVEEEIRSRFYPKPSGEQETSPEQLEREYQENLRQFLYSNELSSEQYQELVRSNLFRQKARERLRESIPRLQEHVYVHWIRTDAQNVPQVKERLDRGDDFAEVAKEMNNEKTYADDSGEVGWIPQGAFPDLDDVMFSLEHNQVDGPIISSTGSFFLKIAAGPEFREVATEDMMNLLARTAVNGWVSEQRDIDNVQVNFNSENYAWIVEQVRLSEPSPTPQTGQGQ